MGCDWEMGSRLRIIQMVEYDEYVLAVGLEGIVDIVDDGDAFVAWDAVDAQPSWLLRSDSTRCTIVSQPVSCDLETRDDLTKYANIEVDSDVDSGPPTLGNVKIFGIFCGQVRLQRRLLELMLPLDYECPIDLVVPLLSHFIFVGRQDEDRESEGAVCQDKGVAGSREEGQGESCGYKRQRRVPVAVWEELRGKLLLEIPDSQIENHAFEVAVVWIREPRRIDELGRKLAKLEIRRRQTGEHVGESNGQARPTGAGVVQQQHQDEVGYVRTQELFEAMFQCGVPMAEIMGICRVHKDHDALIHHAAFVSRLRDQHGVSHPSGAPRVLEQPMPTRERLELETVKKDNERKADLIEQYRHKLKATSSELVDLKKRVDHQYFNKSFATVDNSKYNDKEMGQTYRGLGGEDIGLGEAYAEQCMREEAENGGEMEGWWSLHERTGEFASGRAMKRIWNGLDNKLGELYPCSSKWTNEEELTRRLQVSPREVELRDEFWKAEYEGIKRELAEKQRSLELSKRELSRASRQLADTGGSAFRSFTTAPLSTAVPKTLAAPTYFDPPAQNLAPASLYATSLTSQQLGLNTPASARTVRGRPDARVPWPISTTAWAPGSAVPLPTNSPMLSDIVVRDDPFSPSRSMVQFVSPGVPMLRNSASSGHLPAGIPVTTKAVAGCVDRGAPSASRPTAPIRTLGVPAPAICGGVASAPLRINNAAEHCAVVPAPSAGRTLAGFANDVAALREIARKNPDLKALDENSWFPDHTVLDLTDMDSAEQIGSWKGIVTKDGRVTEMHIRISCLPSAVGRLSALTTLNLTSSISLQTLPDSVGDLHCLDTLKLGACKSLGVLPASLARLQTLTRLDLWHCVCLGGLPVALPKSLKVLNLNGCTRLCGLPARLQDCAYLQALDVSCCSSLASLPSFLGDMPGLACSRGVVDVRNCPSDGSPALLQLRARGCLVQT